MIRFSQNIRYLVSNVHHFSKENHLMAKEPRIIEAYRLQCILRECLTFSQVKQAISENEDRFIKYGKTVILQFLNEFYIDPKYRKMEKPLEIYGFLEKLEDLNLYELTIRCSIYKKISIYYDVDVEYLRRIQQRARELLIQRLDKLAANHESLDFIDGFNILVATDKQFDVSQSMEIINSSILEVAKKVKFGKIYFMLFKRLYFEHGWKVFRKYHNVMYFLTQNFHYEQSINLQHGIDFFHTLSQIKLHKVGPRVISPFLEELIDTIFMDSNMQQLSQKLMLSLFQSFKNMPASFRPQKFLGIYQYLKSRGFKTTHYIKFLPYNKLSLGQVDKIYQQLITYEMSKVWEDGVYFYNNQRIRKVISQNQKMVNAITQHFQKRYLKQQYKYFTDLVKYLGFSIIIFQKKIRSSLGQKSIPSVMNQIYLKFIQNNAKIRNRQKVGNKQQIMFNNSVGKSQQQALQASRLELLTLLSIANILNVLTIMVSSQNKTQVKNIMKELPSIFRKRKQRYLYNNYIKQLLQAVQLYTDQRSIRSKQLEKFILILVLDLISKPESSNVTDYLDLLTRDQQLIIPEKLNRKFDFDDYPKILFNLMKKPSNVMATKLSSLMLKQIDPMEQIVIIELFFMEEHKSVNEAVLLLKFITQERKTNLKNIFLLLGGTPLILLKLFKSNIYNCYKQYFKNMDIVKQFQRLQMQKRQYLLNPNKYKYNCVEDFQLDTTTSYQFLRMILSLPYKQITKFISNFIIEYLKRFPTEFKSLNQFKKAHRFLLLSVQFIKSISYQSISQQNFNLFQSTQKYQSNKPINSSDFHIGLACIPKILNNLKQSKNKLFEKYLIKNMKAINLYTIIKDLQLRCLISDVVPFDETIKDEIVSQAMQGLTEFQSSQIILEVYMVLMKLYCYELIKLENNFIQKIYGWLVQASRNGQISPGWLRYSFSSNKEQLILNIKNIEIWQKYLIPLFKLIWEKSILKKSIADLCFYYLQILVRIRNYCRKSQSEKKVVQLICDLSKYFIYSTVQSDDLKKFISINLNLRNGDYGTLLGIKQQIQHNFDSFVGQWDQVLYYWHKMYYQVPQLYQPFMVKTQQEIKNYIKTHLKALEVSQKEQMLSQDITKISQHFRIVYRQELTNRMGKIFITCIPWMLKSKQENSLLISDYAKIYYCLVMSEVVSERDKKLESIFEKVLMYDMEANKKLESYLDNLKIKYIFKTKIKNDTNKNNKSQQQQKISIPVQYYLPNSNQVLIVLKATHLDIHQTKFAGDLKFDEVLYKSIGKNVKMYNPFTNKLISNEELQLSAKQQRDISKTERHKSKQHDIQ